MSQPDQQFRALAQPLILALDTSSRRTSLCLAAGARVIRTIETVGDERRSERLWLEIDALLATAGRGIESVDLFAVCIGPGGFTGLRVGVAAVKGLAAAAGKPVVGVTSLEAAAMAAGREGDELAPVCSMVGAYKGEVYWQLFRLEDDGIPVALAEPLVSTSNDALKRLSHIPELIFVGDSLEAVRQEIESWIGAKGGEGTILKWRFQAETRLQAESIAHLAFLKMQRGVVETAESLHALYVRPAEAEIKLALGQLGSKIKRSIVSD